MTAYFCQSLYYHRWMHWWEKLRLPTEQRWQFLRSMFNTKRFLMDVIILTLGKRKNGYNCFRAHNLHVHLHDYKIASKLHHCQWIAQKLCAVDNQWKSRNNIKFGNRQMRKWQWGLTICKQHGVVRVKSIEKRIYRTQCMHNWNRFEELLMF